MRIVVFTSQVASQTGGEVNVRDWALGLKARGHRVVVYTPVAGVLAEEIRDAGVAVVDDPAAMTDAPEIMFGSGVNEVAALLARFPDVPVVQVSQQWDSWTSFPSPLPQVVLRVAVDELNAESLVNEFGVPREQVRIVHNSVDLARVPLREHPLPAKPGRALVFVKLDSAYVEAVAAACAMRNIRADFVGSGVGCVIKDPLAAMVEYDLVIGSARTAIEGAVAGAAVLVADHRGLGGLLTTGNLERFRADNFGREILTRPLDAGTIGAELDLYDALDAAAVAKTMREVAALERQLERLEAIFAEAVAAFGRAPPSVEERRKALANYLARHLPRQGEASPRHALPHSESPTDARLAMLDERLSAVSERLSAVELELVSSREDRPSGGIDQLAAVLGECRNLLERSEELDALSTEYSIATLERVGESSDRTGTYLVAAIGGDSEHYVAHELACLHGPLTLSLEARDAGASRIRIQLLDGSPNGVYGDFDFGRGTISIGRIGRASRLNGGFKSLGDGWYRLWITGRLPPSHTRSSVLIQLADRHGRLSFLPERESILVRCIQVERGHVPSPYQATFAKKI